ncbi:hypothetical protein [Mariniflexile sp.]|uniref:hypothetical protein n=1 Tax=Mariniflexile sp. TaxID=1979402 RepID=UPI00356484F9
MKNQKKITRTAFFFICFLIPIMGLTSCSKSDDKDDITNCTNWSDQWLAQANAYSAAAEVYANDPTVDNCGKYKTAGLKYIDALESVIDCVPTGNAKEYIDSLNEYRAEVNAIACN